MIWPVTPPAAALRVMRTVAGRRVLRVTLQLALLVGGLFALGFLCGEQAYAAEGGPTATVAGLVPSIPGKVPTASGSSGSALAGVEAGVGGEAGAVVRSSVGSVVHSVGPTGLPRTEPSRRPLPRHPHPHLPHPVSRPAAPEPVVTPVVDVVRAVAGGLTDGLAEVQAQVPHISLPVLPVLSELPSLPTIPTIPSLPSPVPAPVPVPVPVPIPVPGVGGPVAQPPSAVQGAAVKGPVVGRGAPERVDAVAGLAYGPQVTGVGAAGGEGVAKGMGGHGGRSVRQAPAGQLPGGDSGSGGALGNQSAVDNGGCRHADVHAVSPDHRAPARLVPGAAARADVGETRDRYRDVLVYPG
jgi:hypothetical protein